MLTAGAAASLSALGDRPAGNDAFFTLHKKGGQWMIRRPDGRRLFLLGRHGDDAPKARDIKEWRSHYGRDAKEWINGDPAAGLEQGCFNSWASGGAGCDPYCHLVPFSGAERWGRRQQQVNYMHSDWDEWCDHVARQHCAPRRDESHLIGYFYSSSPVWLQREPRAEWRGPLYDPAMMKSNRGRVELRRLARRYYQCTGDAIRRHDPNHLILGDRYSGNSSLPREVYEEAHSGVDVFSFQDFCDPVESLRAWHKVTGKPVILADTAPVKALRGRDQTWYDGLIRGLLDNPGCVGCHLVTNAAEIAGNRDQLQAWRRVNQSAERWVTRRS